jgi:hypothetical protein
MKLEESFFKKNIMKKKNIYIHQSKFKFEKIVLNNSYDYEGASNNYYKILNVKNKYYLYYRASNNPYMLENGIFNNEPNYHLENTCLAISNDGLLFEKYIPNNKLYETKEIEENNILFKNIYSHNFCPTYLNENNQFIALSGTQLNNNGLFLFISQDGFKWKNKGKCIDEKNIMQNFKHKNHFDTQNTIVYNPIDRYYYLFLRHNDEDNTRKVQVLKSIDFSYIMKSKIVEIKNKRELEIYNFNPYYLENSSCFMSIPNIAKNKYVETYVNSVKKDNFLVKEKSIKHLCISENGVEWNSIMNISLSHMNYNNQICPVNGYIINPEKTKYYFYFQNNVHTQDHEIQCYSIPYNRFIRQSSIGYGYVLTKKILLTHNEISINYKTSYVNKKGFIIVEILDINKKRICISQIYKGNKLCQNVKWLKNIPFKKDKYLLKFHLFNCDLYSFSYNTNKNNEFNYIWSKGVYERTPYMLKGTNCKPNEEEIIDLIKNTKDILWLRNSSQQYLYKDLDLFAKHIYLLNHKIILVSGDGDNPIPSSYSFKTIHKILKNKNIKKWYIQNYDRSIINEKMYHYPIGLDLHTGKWLMEMKIKQKIDFYKKIRKQDCSYNKTKIFCDTHLSKTHHDREIMYQALKDNKNIDFLDEQLDFKEIIDTYRKYKFVLSPRGNGLDCHRTWECFLCGCIVITTSSSLDNMWIEHELPVVILKDWSKLNIDNLVKRLESWYKKFNKFTKEEHILPKFKNSYWLKK